MRGDEKKITKGFFKKGDIIILLVLIVAIVLTVVFSLDNNAKYIEIYVDGTLTHRASLSSDTVISLLDGRMTITVSGGRARVSHSDCPEKLCIDSSSIGAEGGMIVCLPNRVVIKAAGGEVDAVT